MRHEADGILERRDGKDVIRFQRRIPHPIERVWAAIATPTGSSAGGATPRSTSARAAGSCCAGSTRTMTAIAPRCTRRSPRSNHLGCSRPKETSTESCAGSSTRTATEPCSRSRARSTFPRSFASRQSPGGTSTLTRSAKRSTDRPTSGHAGTSATSCRSCTGTRSGRGTKHVHRALERGSGGRHRRALHDRREHRRLRRQHDQRTRRDRGSPQADLRRPPAGELPRQDREIRFLSADVALLRAVVGMVPPGQSDLRPELNAIQTLVGVADRRRVAHCDAADDAGPLRWAARRGRAPHRRVAGGAARPGDVTRRVVAGGLGRRRAKGGRPADPVLGRGGKLSEFRVQAGA